MTENSATKTTESFAIRSNILMLKFARNWLKVALTILAIYVTLPFVAPTLMEIGAETPAKVIYTLYSPFCHQFAFRSFFLYGDQIVYPRENAGTGYTPFEAYVRDLPEFKDVDLNTFELPLIKSARSFYGNDQIGYKLTLCERDIFIYLALFGSGLLYAIPYVRQRIRPAPFWLYIFFGLGPIGIDGFSQLFGYPPFNFWSPRETLPIFRVVTGAIFGFMSGWLGFPYLDRSLRDTRRVIEAKLARVGIKI
jgi:uncharacterized membrane protein